MTNIELYNQLKANLLELYPDSSERLAFAHRLFQCITGHSQQDVVIYPDHIVDVDDESIAGIMRRVLANEPLEYIFNKAQFLDFEFVTNGKVLIPRPETEELVLMVRDHVKNLAISCNILDIGTGSGCIPVSLANYLTDCRFTAFDISADAIDTARQNAERLGRDVDFRLVDILRWEQAEYHAISCQNSDDGRYDVIISNPPYVMDSERALMCGNVLDYEPHNALFVPDGDPLVFYRCISNFAVRFLRPGGSIFFEINERLGKETATLMEDCGLCNALIVKDLFGKDRFVRATLL